jgi:hypothetical protein
MSRNLDDALHSKPVLPQAHPMSLENREAPEFGSKSWLWGRRKVLEVKNQDSVENITHPAQISCPGTFVNFCIFQ